MAGINRLGKAPPKPGTIRPVDPNRFKTFDLFSEGGEGDAEYMRMVRDIEEMQQTQGWLFSRGAFDKADLLYLRDQKDKQRHAEMELQDKERAMFQSLRATAEGTEPTASEHLSGRPPANMGLLAANAPKEKPHEQRPSSKVAPLVRVKPVLKSRSPEPDAPDAKRCKLEDQREEGKGLAGGSVAHKQPGEQEEEDTEGGLLGLIGDYGSDSGSDDEAAGAKPVPTNSKPKLVLPSATELLGLGAGCDRQHTSPTGRAVQPAALAHEVGGSTDDDDDSSSDAE